ncbi:MAG TPA: S-methyl-5-thioribose-1-phosphate isomerase [Clostridiales bacterium]|nr:S-methyl-5-thioribose-1-phosphate isomerase [Clostridiales bacterium]
MDTMRWSGGCLEILDQTLLPERVEYIKCRDYQTVCQAIRRLSVRGAPAIGAAAAYGLALGAFSLDTRDRRDFISALEKIAADLAATRPTAVNLQWALDRLLAAVKNSAAGDVAELKQKLLDEAHAIYREDLESNRRMGRFGQELVPDGAVILTHCNAGALATAGLGTALGVIRAARDAGKRVSVMADETRPLLQGARLTAWEMLQENIPVTLVADNMAGYAMALGKVDLVIVGADRIAANGDVANKIGSYSLAVLADAHGIPCYSAAPLSTVDLETKSGEDIVIEERPAEEVARPYGLEIAPPGMAVANPAFDVTPARLITAIVTDAGVARPPYEKSLAALFGRS